MSSEKIHTYMLHGKLTNWHIQDLQEHIKKSFRNKSVRILVQLDSHPISHAEEIVRQWSKELKKK